MKKKIIIGSTCMAFGMIIGIILTKNICSGPPQSTMLMVEYGLDFQTPVFVLAGALSDTRVFVNQLEDEENLDRLVWRVEPSVGGGYNLSVEGTKLGDIPDRINRHFFAALVKYQEECDKIKQTSNK